MQQNRVPSYVVKQGHEFLKDGRPQEALDLFDSGLSSDPNNPEFLFGRALALRALNRTDEASECLRRSAESAPQAALPLTVLGNLYRQLKRYEEAILTHHEALNRQPNFAEAWSNLGLALRDSDKLDQAIEAFQKAVELCPTHPDLLHNLANALLDQGELDRAVEYLTRALDISPHHRGRIDLGVALRRQGKHRQAIAQLLVAVRQHSNYPEAHYNLGLAYLADGQWEKGWQEYEWRRRLASFPVQHRDEPDWQGQALKAGEELLIHAEQGFGDTIQFFKYLSVLRPRVGDGRIILAVPTRLQKLFEGHAYVDQVLSHQDCKRQFTCHLPLMSLPSIFLDAPNETAGTAYLAAQAERLSAWRKRFRCNAFKIGITWQGNPDYAIDYQRSVPLTHFRTLAKVPNVQLVSLQCGFGLEQLNDWTSPDAPFQPAGDFDCEHAFLDTAALASNLDLIICSDSSVAHLCGALGLDTWVLLSAQPDWRWGSEDGPYRWYSKLSTFRQKTTGDWSELFSRIRKRVEQKVLAESGGQRAA